MKIMGVVNLTPDSFSDGGQFQRPEAAYEFAQQLVADGADIIDLGAESSRPGSQYISAEEEWRRLSPVLKLLTKTPLPPAVQVSVDTNKPLIMQRVADFGVTIVNDIRGGADNETLASLARQGLTYIAMHMHGSPQTMQESPLDAGTACEAVAAFYRTASERLRAQGFPEDRIWLDPGIGFGKTEAANWQLLAQMIGRTAAIKENLVVGISRKAFIGRQLGISEPKLRDGPSKMLEISLLLAGVKVIRTHDVRTLAQLRKQCMTKSS